MKKYILFFFALFICKIAFGSDLTVKDRFVNTFCRFLPIARNNISNCILNNVTNSFKKTLQDFTACFGKTSFTDAMNVICMSNEKIDDVKMTYSNCFDLLSVNEDDTVYIAVLKCFLIYVVE
ncbi:uncharacterized protein LOC111631972 [Centruroides sculpturatus]|uniref:uncharacterized protein LOC111631972 n=1 Tax=Centruroides sculpturatus TaxID=218467 RepID=UPI000C6E5F20|nr:uncharacterized protein LOC111631972 [Centruroides sculpturatus]